MEYRKPYLLVLIAIALVVTMFCCDSTDKPVIDTTDTDTLRLAPGAPDQKVYACPSTKTYHLANCPRLTDDKVVVFKSEAIEQGYAACELCFPTPRGIEALNVYVIEGDNYYHRALCSLLNTTKTVIPLASAIEKGYKPCDECYGNQRSNDKIVYTTKFGAEPGDDVNSVYHYTGCQYLWSGQQDEIKRSKAIAEGRKLCSACKKRLNREW